MTDILEKLEEEASFTDDAAAVCREAIVEIKQLRLELDKANSVALSQQEASKRLATSGIKALDEIGRLRAALREIEKVSRPYVERAVNEIAREALGDE